MTASADSQHYTVLPGDSLVIIGLKFGVPWQSIADANGIQAPYTIYPGQSLVIPAASGCHEPDSGSSDTKYVVKPGDNLVLIGGDLGVPWDQIAEANCIPAPYLIYPGQSLLIPQPSGCGDSESQGTPYTVQAGDDLSTIGQHFGVPWEEIADANCVSPPYLIYPGQVLSIPQGDSDSD
jgi:peptidoglycan DL-endopeptidase CwlS